MIIVERAIGANAVTDAKIRLRNNQPLRARNFSNTADVNLMKLDSSNNLYFLLQPKWNSTATQPDDLVNLNTLQEYVSGVVNLKDPVRVASDANLSLTGSTPLSVDGISLSDGDRVGLIAQTNGIENGIYQYNDLGATYSLTRTSDFDDVPSSEVRQGSTFDVIEGTNNGQKRFLLATVDPTVGTDVLVFVEAPKGVVVPAQVEEQITLNSTDVTNQYFDLLNAVLHPSVQLFWSGLLQRKGVDYTLSDIGGVTRVTLAGDLASAGSISLANGDLVCISYERE